ncbi:uncharacterized protein EI90DRAFT_3138961 [Cantharellus anzutake]|uniref:uncharacterized protein n=1 Tax=Cantharellus anzutake TaxID=1750568 RepID=UPI0019057CF7|nr:uncharacterized protein EI90DRAFT_3138961 [Cantharellus anzutake]KAF8310919.1 hypothetical protein EI90DRAFT_3138961 [Cantharellus anzutake]
MPGPWSREAPRFRGKKVKKFLYEFELQARSAQLSNVQKCEYVVSYCTEREAKFIRTLTSFKTKLWSQLKSELLNFYPAEHEDRVYRMRDLRKFVKKDRKIRHRSQFDDYWRKFQVMASSLEERGVLHTVERDNCFFRGIKPKSFRKLIKHELKAQGRWTDLTKPPSMSQVVAMAKHLLKHDLYRDDDSDIDSDSDDDGSNSDSESSSGSSDESSDAESTDDDRMRRMVRKCQEVVKKVPVKRVQKKSPAMAETSKSVDKKPEPPVAAPRVEPDAGFKSNMDDLADRISKLTIQLARVHERPRVRPQVSTGGTLKCYMCEDEGHGVKDCPETRAFLAAGVLKLDATNRLVMADGSRLPHAFGEEKLAQLIRQKAAMRTTANLEWMRKSETAIHEFGGLGDAVYEVFPAERTEKEKGRSVRSKPYERPMSPQPPPPQVRSIPQDELRKNAAPLSQVYVELPAKPPVILKRPSPGSSSPSRMDVDREEPPSRDKGKQRADPQVASNPRAVSSSSKTKKLPENVEVQDPKRASFRQKSVPAYRFASELQERVKNDDLFECLMDQNVTIPLGMIFGTSYKLNKCLTAAMKIHRIPTRQTNVVEYMMDEEDEVEVEVKAMNTEVSSISKEVANLDAEVKDDDDRAKYTSAQSDSVSKTERADGFTICVNVDAEIASADRVVPRVLELGSDEKLTRTIEHGLRRSPCVMRAELTIDSEIREDVVIPSVDSSFDDGRASIANLDGHESQVSNESFERMSRDDEFDCVREQYDTESLASGDEVRIGECAIVPAPESPGNSIDETMDLDEVHSSQIRPQEGSYEIPFKFDDDESSTMSSGHDGTSERVFLGTMEYETSNESSLDVMAADAPRSREFDVIESAMPECLPQAKVERAIHVQTATTERETKSRELRPPSLRSSIVEMHDECADSSEFSDSGYSEQDVEFKELRPLSLCSTVVEESLSFSPSEYLYQTVDDDEVRDEIRAQVSQSKDPPAMWSDLWNPYGPCGYFMPWHSFPIVMDSEQKSSDQMLGLGDPEIEVVAPSEPKLSAAQPPIQNGGNVIELVETQTMPSMETVSDENGSIKTRSFSFECNMAESSHPNDSGRVNAARASKPDRNYPMQRGSAYQKGSRGLGGLSGPPHLRPPVPGRNSSPPRITPTEPKFEREIAQKIDNGPISSSPKSKERTPDLNTSRRANKRRRGNSPKDGDWKKRDGPWTARASPPTDEPKDERSFADVIREEQQREKEDEKKRQADDERTAEKNKVRESLKRAPHMPMIVASRDVVDCIVEAREWTDELLEMGRNFKSEHDEWVKLLYEALKEQETLIYHLNERTMTLMGGLRESGTKIQLMHDRFQLQFTRTADAAHAVEKMFTATHEGELTNDDYYFIVLECLGVMQRRIGDGISTTDFRYRNFVAYTRLLWDAWGTIFPLPSILPPMDYTELDLAQEQFRRERSAEREMEARRVVRWCTPCHWIPIHVWVSAE